MGRKDKPEQDGGATVICRNRRATHDFEILDTLECGIVLVGTEVKSLREGHAQLEDAFARVEDGEVWLYGLNIPEYVYGNVMNHPPKRRRKLLLHRREIDRFAGLAAQKGLTLVPLKLYFKNGKVKVELALARGKKTYDKRAAIQEREVQRQIARTMAVRRQRPR